MSLKQMQALDTASAVKQEPVRIMGFDCVCGRRMQVSAEQGVVPAQQRTWVGLTDDEQRDIAYSDINVWDWGELMDAVEAKLKEKNQ